MKNSLATTLMACTLMTTRFELCANNPADTFSETEWNGSTQSQSQKNRSKTIVPGIYTLRYPLAQNVENEDDADDAVNPMLAGAFAYVQTGDATDPASQEPEDEVDELDEFALLTSAEKERLYEQIYLTQLYEELELMSDYEQIMTAIESDEAKKALHLQAVEEQLEHDYHEVMTVYSTHKEYNQLMEQLAYTQMMSDYSELMDALAFQEIDPKAFDIRFSSETSSESDSSAAEDETINFAALSPDQQKELHEQMEHGEIAEVVGIINKRHPL